MIAATAASPAHATTNGRFRRTRCQIFGGRTPPNAGLSRVARSTAGCGAYGTGTSTCDGCLLERIFRLAMPAPVNLGTTLADVFGGRKVDGIHRRRAEAAPCETFPDLTSCATATS